MPPPLLGTTPHNARTPTPTPSMGLSKMTTRSAIRKMRKKLTKPPVPATPTRRGGTKRPLASSGVVEADPPRKNLAQPLSLEELPVLDTDQASLAMLPEMDPGAWTLLPESAMQ